MRYSDDKIQEIRDATSIEEVIAQYVNLKKRGKGLIGLCPFHQEKTPSFNVDPHRQFYHCFGCNEGGNVFTFLMKMEGVSFPEAVRTLAEKANIPLPQLSSTDAEQEQETEILYYANQLAADFFKQCLFETRAGKKAFNYLTNRGFTRQIIEEFDLGYAPNLWDGLIQKAQRENIPLQHFFKAGLIQERKGKSGYYDRFRGRLIFPVKSPSGRVIGFGGRILTDEKNVPKYLNSPETAVYHKSRILYGMYESREQVRKVEKLLLVEGYTDVMRLFQSGLGHCAATSGTALTPGQANLIRRYSQEVILIYDGDSAGLSAALRGVDILLNANLNVKVIALPGGEDPDSYFQKITSDEIEKMLETAPSFLDFQLDTLKKGHGLKSSSDKTKAVYRLMETIGHVKDPVQRTLLVKEVSEKMQIDESLLLKQFKKHDNETIEKEPIVESVSVIQKAEQGILAVLLFEGRGIFSIVFEALRPEEFLHSCERDVYQYLLDRFKQSIEIQFDKVRDHFLMDPKFSELFIELEMNRIPDTREQLKAGLDCLLKLKSYKIQEEIKKIQNSLKNNPDPQKLSELQTQYMDLKSKTIEMYQNIEKAWQKTVEF